MEVAYWIKLVSEEFYKDVYEHEWLKDVFASTPIEHITNQQVDFMKGAFGLEQLYSGRNPGDAHTHIFITDEMWQVRELLLMEAMKRTGCPEDIQTKWLKIDNAFKSRIIMQDPSQCKPRFKTDDLIIVRKTKLAA